MRNHWEVALGIGKTVENINAVNVKKNTGTRIIVGTSKRVREKLDQEILDMLNSGIDTNDEIYESLKQSNKLPKRDDQIMAFTTIIDKIQKVRRKNGLSKRENKSKIIEMIGLGIDKKIIREKLKISRSYLDSIYRNERSQRTS